MVVEGQPSQKAKARYFDLLDSLCSGEWRSENNDTLSPAEQRDRDISRGFFHTARIDTQGANAESLPTEMTETKMSTGGSGTERATALATPRRVLSDPTPGQVFSAHIIKATQTIEGRKKGRLGALMEKGLQEHNDTVVPETSRAASRLVQKSNSSTPSLPPLKRLVDSPSEASPSAGVVGRKRRRESGLKARPLEEQMFRGLSFFYIPNNDIAPARRLRIGKSKEYGATWATDMATATHVIVDKDLEYRDIEKMVGTRCGAAPPTVVMEDYPIDCIRFKAVLDPHQKKYRLRGQPAFNENPTPAAVASPPGKRQRIQSLPLKAPQKNPRKWDYAPPTETPPRSREAADAAGDGQSRAKTAPEATAIDLTGIDTTVQGDAVVGKTASGTREDGVSHVGNRSIASTNEDRTSPRDELSGYISMVQEYKDLPLDPDEDDTHSWLDESEQQSDDEGSLGLSETRQPTRNSRKQVPFEQRFACNHAGKRDTQAGMSNPNVRTIEILQRMGDYYDRIDDNWRAMAYRKAISTLKRQTTRITTEEEASKLPSIGGRLAQKIEEIVTTNRLRRLEYAENEQEDEPLQLFLTIYGVGTKQARQWIAQGHRTLDDLKRKAKLTPSQQIGIDHIDDLNSKISRREVEALAAFVRKTAAQVDDEVELIVGGSYRRGAEQCNDIDFIVTKPGTTSSGELTGFLADLVARLEAERFLVARLASSRSGREGSKWHGCCVRPSVEGGVSDDDDDYRPTWRRIDFLLVPQAEMGAALIYFTGDDIFNRSLRLLASKKGMRLNQRGLYRDAIGGAERAKRVSSGSLIEGRDERRIFAVLGVKWREPQERWC